MEDSINYTFKSDGEVFSLFPKLIVQKTVNDNAPEDVLSLKIESEKNSMFFAELTYDQLYQNDPLFKKFEVKDVYEAIKHNINEKSIIFNKLKEGLEFEIVLSIGFLKQNLQPKIRIPVYKNLKNDKKKNDANSNINLEELIEHITNLE